MHENVLLRRRLVLSLHQLILLAESNPLLGVSLLVLLQVMVFLGSYHLNSSSGRGNPGRYGLDQPVVLGFLSAFPDLLSFPFLRFVGEQCYLFLINLAGRHLAQDHAFLLDLLGLRDRLLDLLAVGGVAAPRLLLLHWVFRLFI